MSTGNITTTIIAISGFMANITATVTIMVSTWTRKWGAPSTKNPVMRSASLITRVIRLPVCLLL